MTAATYRLVEGLVRVNALGPIPVKGLAEPVEVPFPLLQAIVELPEDAVHRGLTHLQAAEFLYETRLFPELVYTFKHTLTSR